jgi:hypothetical protein
MDLIPLKPDRICGFIFYFNPTSRGSPLFPFLMMQSSINLFNRRCIWFFAVSGVYSPNQTLLKL